MRNRDYSHPALAHFAGLADQFCSLFQPGAQLSPEDQLRSIHELLAKLYSAALALPGTSVLFPNDTPDSVKGQAEQLAPSQQVPETPDSATRQFAALAEFLGPRCLYREVFDPYAEPSDPEVMGDLIDDISDIHRNLLEGLVAWRSGNFGEALWAWRFSFQSHWGEHATSALRALFALCAWRDVPWPEGAG